MEIAPTLQILVAELSLNSSMMGIIPRLVTVMEPDLERLRQSKPPFAVPATFLIQIKYLVALCSLDSSYWNTLTKANNCLPVIQIAHQEELIKDVGRAVD